MMMPKLHREDLEGKAARHTIANICYGGGWGAGRVDEYEKSITVYPSSHSFFLSFGFQMSGVPVRHDRRSDCGADRHPSGFGLLRHRWSATTGLSVRPSLCLWACGYGVVGWSVGLCW